MPFFFFFKKYELILAPYSSASPKSPAYVPRYDKSLRLGRGDRAPPSNWLKIERKPSFLFTKIFYFFFVVPFISVTNRNDITLVPLIYILFLRDCGYRDLRGMDVGLYS